jgi:putative hydrolase of the HAD superfamily
MTVRALILDFGEVLVRRQSTSSIEEMAVLAGLGVQEFERRYWAHRRAYDRGELDGTAYWRKVIDGPGADGVIEALKLADYRSWTDYREDVWTLAADFRRRGGLTAMLSNGVPEVMTRVAAERRLADHFDAVVISYDVGLTKPDAAIYQLCLARLGVQPHEALFVDDRAENVEGAERLGIRSLRFVGDEAMGQLRAQLDAD